MTIAQTVISRLREGYGADDIAVLDGIDPERVRDEISLLRMSGCLKTLYEGARAKWRREFMR